MTSPPQNSATTESPSSNSNQSLADLAQAFQDIARGEQAASTMEANLTNLESKLDAILAALEAGATAGGSGENDDCNSHKKGTEKAVDKANSNKKEE